MKKIIQFLTILMLTFLGINNVKAEDKYGIYCEYGENKWFLIESSSLNSVPTFDYSDEYGYIFKGYFEKSNYPSSTLSSKEEVAWLISNELLVETSEGFLWNCPQAKVFNNKAVSDLSTKTYLGKNFLEVDTSIMDSAKKSASCGSTSDIPLALPIFIHNIISIIKILIPVLLIILGMLDFGKAVASNDEKTMNESKNKFVKRIIGAVAIFLVVAVTQFIFKAINIKNSNDIISCINCFVNNDCKTVYTFEESDSNNSGNSSNSKNCSDYTYYNCPTTSQSGMQCKQNPVKHTCQYAEIKFECSDYTAETCPARDELNDICKVENNKCERDTSFKKCPDYSYQDCPINGTAENGDECKIESTGGIRMCVQK